LAEALIIDIFCVAVMSILLLSISLQKIESDETTRRFSVLAHAIIAFLISDFFSNVAEGNSSLRVLGFIANLLSFITIDCIIVAFSLYLTTLTGTVQDKWRWVLNPAVFFSYLRILVTLILAATGNLFVMDANGCYQGRQLSVIPYIFTAAILVMLLMVALNNRRHFTRRQLGVVVVYLFLPIPGMVIEMVTDLYSLTAVSLTLSVLLIYVLVQVSAIENSRIRETVLEEISSTDLLTYLNNRRAYYKRFASLEPEECLGVLFCDINGLKRTNDTLGHAEGDKLIVRFADLLASAFNPKDVFRISGDEFVVLVPGISQEVFAVQCRDFAETVKENGSLAALGSAYGTGCCIEQLVSVAESAMYEDKRKNGVTRG